MKNLFILIALVCFSYGIANAQDKAAVNTQRVTKVESKESLKAAQAEPKKVDAAKIEQRAANVKRIDANNSNGVVLTEEQVKEKAIRAERNVRKRDEQ